MLNLFNNNNFSLLDNNLLSYGLLLGSVAFLSYSIYHFTVIFNSNNIKDLPNLQDSETISQTIVENLKAQPITASDKVVPRLSNETLDSLLKSDASVQTDMKMLYEYLQELLYNQGTPVTSLADMEPETFAELLRNDPQGPAYLEHIQNWVDTVPSIIYSNPGTHSSEINFLKQVLESMNSNVSPVDKIANSPIDLILNSPVFVGNIDLFSAYDPLMHGFLPGINC